MKVPWLFIPMVFTQCPCRRLVRHPFQNFNSSVMQHSQSGVALTEFAVALPFLIMLAAGVTDISRLLNQYMGLSEIAHFGVRHAQAVQQINSDLIYISAHCPKGTAKVEFNSLNPTNPIRGIEDKITTLLTSQNLQIDSSSICITTGTVKDDTGTNPLDVYVTITANYHSILSPVDIFPISVRAEAPYLVN